MEAQDSVQLTHTGDNLQTPLVKQRHGFQSPLWALWSLHFLVQVAVFVFSEPLWLVIS